MNIGELHIEKDGSLIELYCGGFFVTCFETNTLSAEAKYQLGLIDDLPEAELPEL